MRVVSVIVVKDGVVNDVQSFGVFEEQLSDDVVKPAEKLFEEKCIEYGFQENHIYTMEDLIEDGCYTGGNFSINLVWSDI